MRLSPWAILHFAASAIAQIVSNTVALIAGGYGLYQAGNFSLVVAGGAGIVMLVLLSSTLRYLYFSYLIQGASVQIREGVFSKKHLNLPFHRIQNVNIEHPFYFRALGLVTIRIESAGSASEEVSLAALRLADGEQIREEIHRFHQARDPVVDSGDSLSAPMLTRSLADLVIHGLTNNRAWIILGAIGALYSQVSDNINTYIAGLGIDFGGLVASSGAIALALIAISALMLAVIFVAAISVLGSIFSYYRYELYRTDEAFRVRRGLLTRHEINMRKSRIQSVRIRRDWLDMILGRMNVIFEQISHRVSGQASDFKADKNILVPSVEAHQTDRLTSEALSAERIANLTFTGISHRYFKKLAVITCSSYLYFGLMVGALVPGGSTWIILLLPPLALHIGLLYMKWKRWGLAIDGGIMVVRKGIVGVDHTLIPVFKIQEIGRIRTPLMKRHGLSSIRFSVASRTMSVPFLPDQVVRNAINYCLFQTESTDRSWM